MDGQARAFWVSEPGRGELRREQLRNPGPEDVRVRTLRSGISRGTESLVFRGGVPPDQYDAMRAPFQDGDFPGPVKYGYLNVGVVEHGPPPLAGRTVFCLFPHQSAYVVPATAVTVVPDGVPADRAVLAGTMETALNAVWDAEVLPGDRVSVVGAGMVGCCLGRLLARMPAVDVQVVDVDPSKAPALAALGLGLESPDTATADRDVVFHTSATSAGLRLALDLVATDREVVELSWYGDRPVRLPLGGRFHSARLGIRATQVGEVARTRQGRRTREQRLALALALLRDQALDALLTGSTPLGELPRVMPKLADGSLPALLHTVTYDDEEP